MTEISETSESPESTEVPEPGESGATGRPAGSGWRRWVPFLGVLCLVLGLGAFWQADRARDVDHVGNHAVVDATGTAEVQAAVSQILVRVFSYDYSDPEPTQRAAETLLAGDAREEYELLFENLRQQAPDQELMLSAQVQVTAVQQLSDDAATLLVFLDQASQRTTDEQSSVSAAQLSVDAERVDGVWKVVGFDPL
ncbi:hypothetical protein FXB39_03285 [Nocardioides sp. BGMRC 2183]|nr:hypothetical protein FXB39_03285 [Nocardioides sp. BGMRC 2183]